MNKIKRLVIPILLGMICICLTPATGHAASKESNTTELTLEVPERPDAQIETFKGAKLLDEITLPDEWTWKDDSVPVQPGRTITVVAVHKDGYEMEIEVTGALMILSTATDSQYTIGTDSSASIHCNGVLDALESIEMDGNTVDPSNYTTKEGSTIVTFKKSYLDTLSVGTHTATLKYEAGSVDSTIEIKQTGVTTTPTQGSTGNTGNTDSTTTASGAQTGDTTNIAGYIMLAVLSLGVCMLLARRRKSEA